MTFKELRNNVGYTTDFMAEKLGIKVTTYRKYECYSTLPGKDILLKMNEIYKCNLEDVLIAYKVAKEIYCKRKESKDE